VSGQDLEVERAKFEAWYGENPQHASFQALGDGTYWVPITQARWEAWLACAERLRPIIEAAFTWYVSGGIVADRIALRKTISLEKSLGDPEPLQQGDVK
jgi:hypothetical protein